MCTLGAATSLELAARSKRLYTITAMKNHFTVNCTRPNNCLVTVWGLDERCTRCEERRDSARHRLCDRLTKATHPTAAILVTCHMNINLTNSQHRKRNRPCTGTCMHRVSRRRLLSLSLSLSFCLFSLSANTAYRLPRTGHVSQWQRHARRIFSSRPGKRTKQSLLYIRTFCFIAFGLAIVTRSGSP